MSLTPVGDYLRKRYPPQESTHWVGQGDDPGCCAGGHAACTYDVGWREALRSLAAELDDLAGQAAWVTAADGLRAAAELARGNVERSPLS